MFLILFFVFSVLVIISLVFFMGSKKMSWDYISSTGFECGFTSWFFSRFSFSIHYFVVALIFLFLDLELCLLLPLFIFSASSVELLTMFFLFATLLVLGLLLEWVEKKLDWIW